MMTETDTDFKFVIQEFSKTMIGARYTYRELMSAERVPFKFQTIVQRLIIPYADENMMIGEHLMHISRDDANFRIFNELKTKIRAAVPKGNGEYALKDITVAEVADSPLPEGSVIQEISFSNLALMGFKL